MRIHTNRYRDFTPAQGIPARITYGSPRSQHRRKRSRRADGPWKGPTRNPPNGIVPCRTHTGSPASERNLKRYRNPTAARTSCLPASMTYAKDRATGRFSPNGGRKRPAKKSRNRKKVWRPTKMRHSNDRCHSAPGPPDGDLESGGTKSDSWGGLMAGFNPPATRTWCVARPVPIIGLRARAGYVRPYP